MRWRHSPVAAAAAGTTHVEHLYSFGLAGRNITILEEADWTRSPDMMRPVTHLCSPFRNSLLRIRKIAISPLSTRRHADLGCDDNVLGLIIRAQAELTRNRSRVTHGLRCDGLTAPKRAGEYRAGIAVRAPKAP